MQRRDRQLNAALSISPTYTVLDIILMVSLTVDTLPPPPAKSSVLVILRLQLLSHSASLQKHCRPLI